MQLDKAENSVAGFTCESSFGDVLDKAEGKINTVFLTYFSEFVGYPSVVTYVFKNTDDSNGNPPLCLMFFDIIQEKDVTRDEQLKEIVDSMDAVLGEHANDEENSEICHWGKENRIFGLSTDTSEVRPETIARVTAFAPPETDLDNLFPYAFGTDIETVYRNETPTPLPEYFANEPYSYYLNYDDGDTNFAFFFAVRDSELKLSSAAIYTDLQETGIEEMDQCLEFFGDSMENILGSADSRDNTPYNKKPSLIMEWPGLEVKAYSFINDRTYSILVNFSEAYFIRDESA